MSPGQACVLYDAADGQARVLGGGVIAGTIAAAAKSVASIDTASLAVAR